VDEGAPPPRQSTPAAERYVLGLLISRPAVREYLLGELREGLFTEEAAQSLYTELVTLARDAAWGDFTAEQVLERLPGEIVSYAEGVRVLGEESLAKSHLSAEAEARALVAALKRRELKGQLAHLQEQLLAGNDKQRTHVLRQFQSITQELARLKTS
jgi:hypothetical protein